LDKNGAPPGIINYKLKIISYNFYGVANLPKHQHQI